MSNKCGKQNGNCAFRDSKDKDRNDKNSRLGETE
jgi:hypothetical protein